MQQVDVTRLQWTWRNHSRYVHALATTWFSSFTYWNSQQFNAALRVLFYPERPQNRVLREYMDIGAFVLTIDDGREYLQLTDEEGWMSTVQRDMTIIMSVIITQLQEGYEVTSTTKYQCPFCDYWNSLKGNKGKSSISWWACHWSIRLWWLWWQTLSRSCKRRFQVQATDQYIDKRGTTSIANNEQDLIQNIHLRQGVSTMISLQGYSWLGSGHVKLSGGAYSHSMSSSFNINLILTSFNAQKVRIHIPSAASSILTSFRPLRNLRECVMPFHELLIRSSPCFDQCEVSGGE